MRRMNNRLDNKNARNLVELMSATVRSRNNMRQTPEAVEAIENDKRLAVFITASMDKANSVEELIRQEMVLQRLDRSLAQSEQDKSSIENAERDYRKLAKIVDQMRRSPAEYFEANLSLRETRDDFRKIPRARGPEQINANKARLQNRALFAPEEQRAVWKARIALADKTMTMFRTLHDILAKNHEKNDAVEP